MTAASPEHNGKNSTTGRSWDADGVCRTLRLWYPDLLSAFDPHKDMRDKRKAMEFLACLQDYPDYLQDLLILLAQRSGIREATMALDNAIRKDMAQPRSHLKARGADSAQVSSNETLIARAS